MILYGDKGLDKNSKMLYNGSEVGSIPALARGGRLITMRYWATLLGVLTVCVAVFTQEEFRGTFSLPWRWCVQGNTPLDTADPSRYEVSNETLDIYLQPGTLTLSENNARNIATVRVGPAHPGWYVETKLTLDLGGATGAYIQAGLIWLHNADWYYTYHLVLSPFSGNLFLGTAQETYENGMPVFRNGGAQSGEWSPQLNTVILRIQDRSENFDNDPTNDIPVGQFFEVWYDNGDGNGMRWLITVPTVESGYPGWEFMTAIPAILRFGGRIGLYTDISGYAGEHVPVAMFDYFRTNLPLLPAADINGDCIVDDADLLSVLFQFGASGECMSEDVTGDGVVDDADLLTVLFSFGSGCR